MITNNETKIHLLLKLSPIFLIVVSICITYYILNDNNIKFKEELLKIEQNVISKSKIQVKNDVDEIYELIQYEKNQAEIKLKNNIKNHLYEAHTIAMSIYENNKDKSEIVVTKMIKDAIRNIRFNEGRGYFFIYDLDAVNILSPKFLNMEGKNATNMQDTRGNYPIRDILSVVKKDTEGFTKWWWQKPTSTDKQYEKLGFSKLFKPFNWIISTGEYVVDWEDTLKSKILHRIQNLTHHKNEYIFISNYDGLILSHFNLKLIGQNKIDVVDNNGYYRLKEVMKKAKKEEGFISYNGSVHPLSEKESKKISFVKAVKSWEWVIVSGVYLSDINQDIVLRQNKLNQENSEQITRIMIINIVTFGVLLLFTLYISYMIKKRFEEYKVKVEEQQNKLIVFNNNLETEIKIRTAEYQSAAADAQSANKAKSTFLANMSHEIRTPLNAILGFVNILKDNETDKEKSKYLETIITSSNSLLLIISDILDFAKVESGNMTLDIKPVNPHLDFGEIGALFFAKAENMNLRFSLYIDPHLPRNIKIDSLKIRQILSNLLSNALKFSHENGTVTLKIKYNADDSSVLFIIKDTGIGIAKENHEKIFLSFSQEENSTSSKYGGTGLGLSISTKILELMGSKLKIKSETGKGSEFYFTLKIDLSTEKSDDFTLLPDIKSLNTALLCDKNSNEQIDILKEYLNAFGMKDIHLHTNVKEIILTKYSLIILNSKLLKESEIQSLLDDGYSIIIIKTSLHKTFTNNFHGKFSIIDPPFTPSSIHDALLELFVNKKVDLLSLTKKETIKRNFDKNANILIAEDNNANQLFMSVIMKKLGLQYSFANDGLEAITMFKNGTYDLILMDENMPNMNGTEATQKILLLEEEKGLIHTPIIALTANAIKGDRERFLTAGMDEYLSKPVVLNDLIRLLTQFLPDNKRN
jgi:signal transduction histidine kinase/ActR/RegA family two-component response regulator